MKYIGFFLCVLVIPIASWGDSWIGPTSITSIETQPNNNIYIVVEVATPNLGCTGYYSGYLQLDNASPHFSEQFSVLTLALMSNKQVMIYVSGCGYYPYAQNTILYR